MSAYPILNEHHKIIDQPRPFQLSTRELYSFPKDLTRDILLKCALPKHRTRAERA